MRDFPLCKKCNANKWSGIPDSLAFFCEGCGDVIVISGDDFEKGTSIKEWLDDIYGKKQEE